MATAGNSSTKSTSRPTTPSASSNDGPVLNLINKRIRAIRKKLNRITQMEDAVAAGKSLNKEQQETLSTKPSLLAQIDELEKLKPSLQSAVAEEHSLAVKLHHQSEPPKASSDSESAALPSVDLISDLLNLLYFGSIFDVKTQGEFTSTMLTRTHERGCCLTYDYVTDEAVDLLGEKDLDFISKLSGCLISRPVDSGLSHKGALERCVEYAKLWLEKSEQPIGADANVTYAGLREKLNKIMASEYMTITPEIKVPEFGSFEVPLQGGNLSGQGEVGVTQYEQQDEVAHYQGQEFAQNESTHLEGHKVEATEDHYEGSLQQDQSNQGTEVEDNHQESEQYVHRRGYNNQGYQNQRGSRGGNRRGSSNGRGPRGGSRGGGQYQNGGRNQYYDQSANYYPRNKNNYRGRGAGSGAGGNGYNNYGGNAHASHTTGDVGVAS